MKKQNYPFKKSAVSFVIFLFIISCSAEKNKQTESSQNPNTSSNTSLSADEKQNLNGIQADSIEFSRLDTLVKNDLKILGEKYPWIPYYGKIDNKPFYISSTQQIDYSTKLFTGLVKYGLINNSLLTVLDTVYDKISNPDLVLKDCFEISIGSKVGLYNYRTQEILQPQFDYILPSQEKVSEIAYGFKNDAFYVIKNSGLNNIVQQKIDFAPILKSLNFDILKINQSMMFNSYYYHYGDDPEEGKGVIIVPSYVSHFKLLEKNAYSDIILPEQKEKAEFGTETANTKTSVLKRISTTLMTFLVEVYESGINGRGYSNEAKKLIVYNDKKESIKSIHLWEKSTYYTPCDEQSYRFIGDTLIEIRQTERDYDFKDNLYDYEPRYSYYQITKDGQINKLNSNRHFIYTKYALIDESYFYGCFAKSFENESYDDGDNMWQSNHLTLEDLDLMRNEIFAEYGLMFKSEKWFKYFLQKPWYTPRFDDVNGKLTPIDKANLKIILKQRELLLKDEQKYTKKRAITYHEAG